jgi:hypothetical protein
VIEALVFAAAIEIADYKQSCAVQKCTRPVTVVVDPVIAAMHKPGKNGWYSQGTAYIKDRESAIAKELTTFHEYVHHLQYETGRYHGYRGACNQWLAEKEAYEMTAVYAKQRGYILRFEAALEPYERKCRNAVSAGVLRDPAEYSRESRQPTLGASHDHK